MQSSLGKSTKNSLIKKNVILYTNGDAHEGDDEHVHGAWIRNATAYKREERRDTEEPKDSEEPKSVTA